jgi:hypothetical protein
LPTGLSLAEFLASLSVVSGARREVALDRWMCARRSSNLTAQTATSAPQTNAKIVGITTRAAADRLEAQRVHRVVAGDASEGAMVSRRASGPRAKGSPAETASTIASISSVAAGGTAWAGETRRSGESEGCM